MEIYKTSLHRVAGTETKSFHSYQRITGNGFELGIFRPVAMMTLAAPLTSVKNEEAKVGFPVISTKQVKAPVSPDR